MRSTISGDMPWPVSETDNFHIIAGRHTPFGLAAGHTNRSVHDLDVQLAASGHCIACINHEIEDGGLELDWINPAMPQIWPTGAGKLDRLAGRPPQKTLRDRQQMRFAVFGESLAGQLYVAGGARYAGVKKSSAGCRECAPVHLPARPALGTPAPSCPAR
jgi:hypothetical protein